MDDSNFLYGGGESDATMMDCSSTSSMNISVHYGDMDMSTSAHCISEFPDMDSSTIALAIVGRDNELATPFDEDCLESQCNSGACTPTNVSCSQDPPDSFASMAAHSLFANAERQILVVKERVEVGRFAWTNLPGELLRDYKQAVVELKAAAASGSVDAMYNLGVLLANELGELEMSEVLRKELTRDGVERQRKLQQLKCNLRVIQLWTEASESGHLGATYALAMVYLTGWDGAVDEDFDRAEAMATKAAMGGMCKAESVVHMACEMRQKKRRRRAQEIVTLARERRRAGLYVNTLVQGFV